MRQRFIHDTNDNVPSTQKTFIIATLVSTIIGTFTTGMGLYDRVDSKRKQKKVDTSQNDKIVGLEKQIKEMAEKERNGGGQRRLKSREDDLRDSLVESGPMIRREYNHDFARLGDKFAKGDCKFVMLQDSCGEMVVLTSRVQQPLPRTNSKAKSSLCRAPSSDSSMKRFVLVASTTSTNSTTLLSSHATAHWLLCKVNISACSRQHQSSVLWLFVVSLLNQVFKQVVDGHSLHHHIRSPSRRP
jgi:hypothetical protein